MANSGDCEGFVDHRTGDENDAAGGPQGSPSPKAPNSPPGSEWFQVTFSLPWIVQGADTPQDAIDIAVSEVGKRIENADGKTRNADLSVQQLHCSECGAPTEALLLVAGTALVGLLLTLEVRAASPDTAELVARREIGPHLPDTPLTTVDVVR